MVGKDNIIKVITMGYFIIAFFEIVSEYVIARPFICILKPLITLTLIILYCIKSQQPNKLFIWVLLLSLLTNILFIPNTPKYLFYAIIVFTIHRILIISLIFSLQKTKDYIPILIATAPFLLIFFYLFMETPEIPEDSYYILIVQNILISMLAGISLSSYTMHDNKQNSILLISTLLFVMLQFVVFIEKYFLTNEFQELFRPLAMTLNALAFFAFYNYVITAEKSNHND